MPSHQFIAVAGNIGAGKSTLTQMLADHFQWKPFFEANADNPYLADFYEDMSRWSFHSQVFFLGRRLEHHKLLTEHPGTAIQDRTVYEDAEIFACNLYRQGVMSERDYDAYRHLYKAAAAFLPAPDFLIYLKSDVSTLQERIANRGRDFERNIDPAYLAQLNTLYEEWISDWTLCPVLTLDMTQMDFQHNPADFANIVAEIQGMAV